MEERPNFLIAATQLDAKNVKSKFPTVFSSWHVITPRAESERGWTIGEYTWTPQAQALPARTRMNLRQRLAICIDEHSNERHFSSVTLLR